MIAFLNLLFVATFTALGTFVAVRLPFLTWGVPILPDAQEIVHWKGLVFGWCTLNLQIPGVWLAGLLLGPRLGATSQMVVLAVGLAGLPIFADGGGFGYVTRPTFGYLLGFIPAAFVIGLIAKRGALAAFLGLVIGQGLLWLIGLTWQVTALGGLLDGAIWSRSAAGVLQLAPTYFAAMLILAGVNGFIRSLNRAAPAIA